MRMHRYIGEVHKTVEKMMASEAAPENYKDDKYWPTPPLMVDLGVPQRMIENVPQGTSMYIPAPQPITVNVAPVINAHPGEGRGLPAIIEPVSTGQRAQIEDASAAPFPPRESERRSVEAELRSDKVTQDDVQRFEQSLADLKVATVRAIAAVAEAHEPEVPEHQRDPWRNQLAAIAADVTASETPEGIAAHRDRAEAFIKGQAA